MIIIPKPKTENIKPLIIGLVKNALIKELIKKKPSTKFKIIKIIILCMNLFGLFIIIT
jgi:hypothetical protein